MKKALFMTSLLFIFILISTNVFAVKLIKAGPHGEPVLVMDAAGNFSIAIKVYSDSELDIYIPNLTAPGWIQWNKEAFINLGVYQTVVYQHLKKNLIAYENCAKVQNFVLYSIIYVLVFSLIHEIIL